MGTRRESEPLQKVTLNLYKADYLALQDHYTNVDTAKVIRALIRQHLDKLDRAKAEVASTSETLEIEGVSL